MSEQDIMKLYNKYEHLVQITVNRHYGNRSFRLLHGLDKDDLMQYGRLGLYDACKTYDESKGKSFRNYAISNINWRIRKESKKDSLSGLDLKSTDVADRISFDIEYTDSEGEKSTLYDIVESNESGYNEVEANILLDSIGEAVSERVKDVLALRMNGYTFEEIADDLGISNQRVQQIMKESKDKILSVMGA